MQPELLYMHEHNNNIHGGQFCALALGGKCGAWEEVNNWDLEVPDGKPPVEEPSKPEVSLIL